MIALSLRGVSKSFAASSGVIRALDGFSLDIPAGQFVVIVGPNGSGKSTLLNLIAGTEHLDSGTIRAVDKHGDFDWGALPATDRSRRLSRVHQDPKRGSASELSVGEHLRLAELSHAPNPFLVALTAQRKAALSEIIMGSALQGRIDAAAGDLSGGQRQLLALEMATARKTDLLLLDEPTASLDRGNSALCLDRIEALQRERSSTTVLVTHDLTAAARIGDRLIVLADGRVTADVAGPAKSILKPEDVFRLSELQSGEL